MVELTFVFQDHLYSVLNLATERDCDILANYIATVLQLEELNYSCLLWI